MQLTQRIQNRTERSARSKRRRHQRPAATPTRDQARVGPPEDRATYNCSCGFVFQADVTTSIGCPHCGTELAW